MNEDQQTDRDLVERSVIGDLRAFDELVRRYRRAATVVAKTVVGSQDAAEDVAQEALVLAYKALPQLGDPARFSSWLCAITRNCARKAKAADRSFADRPLSEFDALLVRKSAELSRRDGRDRRRSQLIAEAFEAIGELPADVSEPMNLFYGEGWPAQRIAEFFGLPLTTVKWRLHEGRRRLRRRLRHELEEDYEYIT